MRWPQRGAGPWSAPGPLASTMRRVLMPAAVVFGAITRARRGLYRLGCLYSRKVATPVVSIGNLRVGGTGKTPLSIWLVDELGARGLRAVVVSRGYGRDGSGLVVTTTDTAPGPPACRGVTDAHGFDHVHVRADGSWEQRTADAEPADEALLVAMRTGAPTVVGSDRVLACRLAERLLLPDVIVLDDGFQHLRLSRDVDVVALAADDAGAGVLPSGPLREPLSALAAADFVVCEDAESVYAQARGASESARGRPGDEVDGVVVMRRGPGPLVGADGGVIGEATDLSGRNVVSVAGIARPLRFEAMLADLGARVVETLRFADHHRYSAGDVKRIAGAAAGADRIVTTEKDLVKLAAAGAVDPRLAALRLEICVSGGGPLLDRIERISRLDAKDSGLHHRPLDLSHDGSEVGAGTAEAAGSAESVGSARSARGVSG